MSYWSIPWTSRPLGSQWSSQSCLPAQGLETWRSQWPWVLPSSTLAWAAEPASWPAGWWSLLSRPISWQSVPSPVSTSAASAAACRRSTPLDLLVLRFQTIVHFLGWSLWEAALTPLILSLSPPIPALPPPIARWSPSFWLQLSCFGFSFQLPPGHF